MLDFAYFLPGIGLPCLGIPLAFPQSPAPYHGLLGKLHQNGTCPVRYHFKMNFSNQVFRRYIRHQLPLADSEMYVFTVLNNMFTFYSH